MRQRSHPKNAALEVGSDKGGVTVVGQAVQGLPLKTKDTLSTMSKCTGSILLCTLPRDKVAVCVG